MKLSWPVLLLVAGIVISGSALAAQMPEGPSQPPATQSPAVATQPAAATPESSPASDSGPAAKTAPKNYVVPIGTRLPLILHNAVTTRNAKPGDPVYLETLFPIVIDQRILIPAGSYVQGEIVEARRPGKVKGTGEIRLRLNSMILPNGYAVDFNAVPTNAGTGGNEATDKEGNIHGDTDKVDDVATVVKSTGIGAGIGAIAGQGARGAGIGAGVGAAVGIAAVLLTRGPELELPRGTTVDAVLDRMVYLDASRVNFTDPGHASDLPGPPSREPVRSRSPI
jgi:type IV secretion system protein VirB10